MLPNRPGARPPVLDADALARVRAIRDLTDPAGGPHAIQLVVARIEAALRAAWGCDLLLARTAGLLRSILEA